MKKRLLAMSIGIVSCWGLILPLAASGACAITGEVVRMADTAGSSTAYLTTTSLATVYYMVTSIDSDLRDALRSCQNSGKKCYVVGSAATCPSTGTARPMGSAVTIIANP